MSINKDESVKFDLERTSLDFLEKHDSNLRLAFNQQDYRKALYHIDQALKIASASQKLKLSRYLSFLKKRTCPFKLFFTKWIKGNEGYLFSPPRFLALRP